jgi:uracil phosphoribosyltransferase
VKNVTIVDHPLLDDSLARMRNQQTAPAEFRRAVAEATTLVVCEATRELAQKTVRVATPLAPTKAKVLKHPVLLVPVLRAGLGMLDAALKLLPRARVGMIGLARDERTLLPAAYKESLPDRLGSYEVLVLDPMLATGGSAVAACARLFKRGAKRVRLLHLLAAPEGVRHVQSEFPQVPIVVGAMDRRLNGQGYIVPGLGDAGDRQFGV